MNKNDDATLRIEIEIWPASGTGPVPLARAAMRIRHERFMEQRVVIQKQIEELFSSLAKLAEDEERSPWDKPGFWYNHSI